MTPAATTVGAQSGRTGYAEARLREEDEERSRELARDPRVYRPSKEEETERPCGARRMP